MAVIENLSASKRRVLGRVNEILDKVASSTGGERSLGVFFDQQAQEDNGGSSSRTPLIDSILEMRQAAAQPKQAAPQPALAPEYEVVDPNPPNGRYTVRRLRDSAGIVITASSPEEAVSRATAEFAAQQHRRERKRAQSL